MINDILLILAIVTAAGFALAAVDLLFGYSRLAHIAVVDSQTAILPSVSIIVPARDEAQWVEACVNSLLSQDYPTFDVVVVDDRSTDATGAILDRLAASQARLSILHIDQLPAGWLGKNHALNCGADRAAGELLLFADGDVVMHPDTLRLAVQHLQKHQLDQVSALPDVPVNDPLLDAFIGFFGVNFLLFLRPWKAADPASRRFIGIGAFTLLRHQVYRNIGGHAPIAMRPDDDIKLGQLVKMHGYQQQLIVAYTHIQVEWYSSFTQMVDGLMKNAYAAFDYRLPFAISAAIGQFLLYVWPYAALFLTTGSTRWLNVAHIVVVSLVMGMCARRPASAWRVVLGVPAAASLTLLIIFRAVLLTHLRGGIRWRGTFYPLAQLRAPPIPARRSGGKAANFSDCDDR